MGRWDSVSDLDYREECGDVDEHELQERLREEAAHVDYEQQSREALLTALDRALATDRRRAS